MAVNTIGTGGDFSTPQLWEDSIPAVLTESMTGQLFNQEFTSAVNVIDFSAHTTTPAFFILLTCAAGASFQNNANVRTNALRYNAANGAAMRATSAGRTVRISGTCNDITFQGLQLANTGNAYQNQVFSQGGAAQSTNMLIKDCILEETIGGQPVMKFDGGVASGVTIVNCLILQRSGAADGIQWNEAGTLTVINCTVVAPSNNTSPAIGINKTYNTAVVINTAVFGFATDVANLNVGTDNNATAFPDAGSGFNNSANVFNVTYDNTLFVQTSDAGGLQDFRLLGSTALQNAGQFNANATSDISGFARSNPPDIGAWEVGSSGAPGGGFFAARKHAEELFTEESEMIWGAHGVRVWNI